MNSGMAHKIFFSLICIYFMLSAVAAQTNEPYVRVAKIIVDSSQLNTYMSFLKEGVEMAIQKEPGVLRMYAVAKKIVPTELPPEKNPVPVVKYNFYLQLCCI